MAKNRSKRILLFLSTLVLIGIIRYLLSSPGPSEVRGIEPTSDTSTISRYNMLSSSGPSEARGTKPTVQVTPKIEALSLHQDNRCQKNASQEIVVADADAIASYKNLVYRSDTVWNDALENCTGTLHLKLKNNREKVLKDHFDARHVDQVILHSLIAYLPSIGFYVIGKNLYEGKVAVLISQETGKEFDIFPEFLLLSPGGGNLASWSTDLVAQFNPNGLDIWQVKNGHLSQAYSITPSKWGFTDVYWKDAKTLVFSKLTQVEGEYMDATDEKGAKLPPSCIVLAADHWHLREPCFPELVGK